MDKPTFSIVTPVLNGEKTISRTIESVLDQTLSPLEYIVIDGNSGDKTLEIAESYSDRFREKGIEYHVISESDKGIYDAMNKGIGRCRGMLVGIINSDDWYEDGALEKISELFMKSPFDMAYADLRIHTGKGMIIKKARDLEFASSRRWNHPTQFVKRDIYDRKKYEIDGTFGDLDFLLWLLKNRFRISYVNEVLANFSMGGASNSGRRPDRIAARVRQKWAIYKRYGYGHIYLADIILVETAKALFG